MSAKYFYFKPHSMSRNNEIIENSDNDEDDDDNDDNDDDEEVDFIPYYSSSVDRSSVNSSIRSGSSIPWADDAIKKNQLDWERLERLLRNDEAATMDDPVELRQEILEWQQKFPILLQGQNKTSLILESTSHEDESYKEADNTLNNIESLSIASFSSQENDEDLNVFNKYEDVNAMTPTNQTILTTKNSTAPHIRQSKIANNHLNRIKTSSSDIRESLADVIAKDLHISSVPLKLGYRNTISNNNNNNNNNSNTSNRRYAQQRREAFAKISSRRSSSSTYSANNSFPPHESQFPFSQKKTNSAMTRNPYVNVNTQEAIQNTINVSNRRRMQMPPILNVLESKRSFLALPNSRNRSFVQLTNVPQQVKSAAVLMTERNLVPMENPKLQPLRRNSNKSTWYVPFITAAVNKRVQNNRNAVILPSLNATHASAKFSSSDSSSNSLPWRQHQRTYVPHGYQDLIQHSTTTSGTVPSTGRSVSSAMTTVGRNPRIRYTALYNF